MEWIIFGVIVLAVFIVDLGVFHKENKAINIKEALLWSAVWIVASLLFAIGIYYFKSEEDGLLFLTGYLVEKSLSVDNLFLFLIIFRHFSISNTFQHKILFWGILGAIVTRGLVIWAGVELIQHYDWITYVFGALIVYVGIKTAFVSEQEFDVTKTKYFHLIQKYFPIKWEYSGPAFFTKDDGRFFLTPLFVVLIVIEISDILFALDSVPAILSITTDPFLVYTSNLFAILGLRSLYFVLADMADRFVYLSHGVSAILVIVGIKILLKDLIHFSPTVMLLVIASILIMSIGVSLKSTRK